MVLDNGDFWEPEDFQCMVVEDLFAGVPELWMVVPEGNAKTTLMSGVGLYVGDFTQSASILMAAASREQAGLLFFQAAGFVDRSPGFRDRFRVFEGYRRISCLRSQGRLQVMAADDRTGDGVLFDLAFLDELHRHRDLRLYRTWRGKLAKRNGQIVAISTAGEPESEFENARRQMLEAVDGIKRDGFHTRAASKDVVIHDWSVPEDADVEDLDLVEAANPLSTVTRDVLEAKRRSPSMIDAHWRRFTCNQAVRSDSSAITPVEWASLRSSDTIPDGEPIWAGLDVAWKWDTTAVAPLWMPDVHRRLFGKPTILTPPRDGTSLPPEEVQEALLDLHQANPVHTVVMDEAAGGAQLVSWIELELGARVVSHSQGHTAMALAYERWMEAMREGWLQHTGDPEFARHVLNAIARVLPGGQVRFDRPARSRAAAHQDQRVWDALTAASMVHSVAVGEAAAAPPSLAVSFL